MVTGVYLIFLYIFRKKEWIDYEVFTWGIFLIGIIEYIALLKGYYFI